MKRTFAVLIAAGTLFGCASQEPAKVTGGPDKDLKPETGKLSELTPGGGQAKKGADTGSLN